MSDEEKKQRFCALKEKAKKYGSNPEIQRLIAKLELNLDGGDLDKLEELIKALSYKNHHY